MRNAAALLLALTLVGCGDRPDISACEDYLKSGLRSPATYRRISVQTFDQSNMSAEAYLRELGERPENVSPELMRGYRLHRLGIRSVLIRYDAANAYGTPIQNQMICRFQLEGSELAQDQEALQSNVKQAEMHRDFRRLVDSGGAPNMRPGEVPDRPCCM